MKVLLLGPDRPLMMRVFSAFDDEVVRSEDRVTPDMPLLGDTDFVVSYGYRHIIKPEVLALFPERAINLHISYLPWNRGADPNLWSFLEDSPKGITIHRIDAGIDTGDILVQREVPYVATDTLKTSHERLSAAMLTLFSQTWGDLRSGVLNGSPQSPGRGTFHRLTDRERFAHLLSLNWDTPVSALIGKALHTDGEKQE